MPAVLRSNRQFIRRKRASVGSVLVLITQYPWVPASLLRAVRVGFLIILSASFGGLRFGRSGVGCVPHVGPQFVARDAGQRLDGSRVLDRHVFPLGNALRLDSQGFGQRLNAACFLNRFADRVGSHTNMKDILSDRTQVLLSETFGTAFGKGKHAFRGPTQ